MKQIKNVIKVKKHGENSLLKFTLKIWYCTIQIFERFLPSCTSLTLIKLILYFIIVLLMNERDLY